MRLACFGILSFLAATAGADTLFLRSGKSLKIEALSCDHAICVAGVSGGQVEVRSVDVVRVEPDEPVDVEVPLMSGASDAGPARRPTLDELVNAAARRYALPSSLIRAVARVESSLDPAAVSPKGALGVMQLMPGTAKDLGVRDVFDPAENVDAGARLLRQLLEKYEGRLAEALAAYNAGGGAVTRHGGVPPYRETRGYIRKVVRNYEREEKMSPSPRSAGKP